MRALIVLVISTYACLICMSMQHLTKLQTVVTIVYRDELWFILIRFNECRFINIFYFWANEGIYHLILIF